MSDNEATPAADGIDDFPNLYPRQTSLGIYRVLHVKEDDTCTHYKVDINDGSCSCEDYEYNADSGEACKHLAAALYQAKKHISVEQQAVTDLSHIVRDAQSSADELERLGTGVAADISHAASEASDIDTETSDDGGSAEQPDDDSVVLDAAGGTDDEQAALEDLQSWFNQAAGFNGFDGEIVDLTVTEIAGHADHLAGERVIQVERQPFSGGYYDDGEWQDKEAFDEHKEACGDSILSPRDEFHWFGEPDYAYVIPVDDVAEVTE